MSYAGVYINLDRSTARRAAMEAQIARHGLKDWYRRFPAADGNVLGVPTTLTPGEIGGLTSHYLVAKAHLDCPTHLHVVEDDALFSAIMHRTIRRLIAGTEMDRLDLLFFDNVINPLGHHGPKFLKRAKTSLDDAVVRDAHGTVVGVTLLKTDHVGACTSYLINRGSIGKLKFIYEEALTEGAKEPVDRLIRRKGQEGSLRVGCVFPFLTSVRLDELETAIAARASDASSVVATALLRHSFFVERDIAALLEFAQRLLPPPSVDPHLRLCERLLGFFLTPAYREFLPT